MAKEPEWIARWSEGITVAREPAEADLFYEAGTPIDVVGEQINVNRLIDWGDSWVAPPQDPYLSADETGEMAGWPSDGDQWATALRNALGVGPTTDFTKEYYIPSLAAAASMNWVVDYLPGDCTIESVTFVPQADIAASGSAYRTFYFSIGVESGYGLAVMGQIDSKGGMAWMRPYTLWNINASNPMGPASWRVGSPFARGLYYPANWGANPTPRPLFFTSGPTGSCADGGGKLIVRYGTRYRNYAISGSTLLGADNQYASWWAALSYSPWTSPNAVEVNVTADYTTGGSTIQCSPLQYALNSGLTVGFSNGVVVTLQAGAAFGATSISVPTNTPPIPKGAQGHYRATGFGFNGGYEHLTPVGINTMTWGINDSNNAYQDIPAWIETVRAVISRVSSPVWSHPMQGNVNPSGSTWETVTPIPNGRLPFVFDSYWNGSCSLDQTRIGTMISYIGSGSGSPKCEVTLGPAFEGGTVDVMLLAMAGVGFGVAGTITVDGVAPLQGPVKFNTSDISTSGLLSRAVAGTTASGTTLTFPSGAITQKDVGKIITGSNIFAGCFITGILSATTCQTSKSMLGNPGTVTVSGYVPMVKRINDLTSGPHKITITVDSVDSALNSCMILYGVGAESQTPKTPVMWANISEAPIQSTGQKNAAKALNAATAGVIQGPAVLTSRATNGTAITFDDVHLVNTNMRCIGPGIANISVASVDYAAGVVTLVSGNALGGDYTFTSVIPTPASGTPATPEPTLGNNVQYVDVASILNAAPDNRYWLPDGLHPNSLGHRMIAKEFYTTIRSKFTLDQLIA